MAARSDTGFDKVSQQSHGTGSDSSPSPVVQDEKEAPPKSAETFISAWYVWEVLAVVVSAGTLIAMVAMLLHFDHKPQPAWRMLSLNSAISWLSTISKACVLFSINECIGQLKHFAVWGSLAIILALAFDPFIQNLIHYYSNMVVDPSQKAFLPNSTRYEISGLLSRPASRVDPVLKANVYSSLFNADQSKPWAIPQYLCSSSNCTWDPVASLGARAVCSNVTDHLIPSCHNTTDSLELNCSLTLANSSTAIWFVPDSPLHQQLAVTPVMTPASALVYKNATFSPIQFIAARGIKPWREMPNIDFDTNWEAIECSIEPAQSNLVATDFTLKPNWGPELGASPTQNFSLFGVAVIAIDDFLTSIFNGVLMEDVFALYYVPSGFGYAGKDVIEALVKSNMSGCSLEVVEKFNCSMHNVAAAISKSFRDSAYISAGSDPGKAQIAAGRVMRSMTYVAVQWQWIVLPVLVWLLGAVTLVGTVWKTRRARAPKWRNDPLPLLFLYREEKNEGVSDRDIDGRADSLKVRMYESDQKRLLRS
ncbi:DUF3176 domain-containing protein [Aspergillus thermomutatus]|uniref:Uncharacterized protein n=1 Tax=Aspergillus thermomutatus TaxID=41047 RepID=A0A397H3I4_ASPTH|nr:uncharacterized protein CDV56_103813 [Aspergillus thermomutatus]RHZ56264.1 hypothetical protein CDV56_103813 [Aspergillus thermomutatus]